MPILIHFIIEFGKNSANLIKLLFNHYFLKQYSFFIMNL